MEELFQEFSVINTYGENLTKKEYVTNPAIAREDEIKKLILVLLTPEKSGLLVGKAGIGKTAIVEGLAYLIQKNEVPVALQNYRIIKINSTSLLGKVTINGREELVISLLMEELKQMTKTILFIDEIHTLMGSSKENPMDLANILKPGLDRGDIKVIGATTTEEVTVQILLGTIPKIEKQTGCIFVENDYLKELLVQSIVSATSEFKRVYGLSAMYPDVAFSVLQASFSNALFENRNVVSIIDVYNAIKTSKRIYPDSIIKELDAFREKFKKYTDELGIVLPVVSIDEVKGASDYY